MTITFPMPKVPIAERRAPSRDSPLAHTVPDRRDDESRRRLLDRVEAEYREMPGLSLTFDQARRLFALRADICDRVLRALVQRTLLDHRNGRYCVRPASF